MQRCDPLVFKPFVKCIGVEMFCGIDPLVLRCDPLSTLPLLAISLTLAAELLLLARVRKDVADAYEMLHKTLADGNALERFCAMVRAPGGDPAVGEDPQRWPQAATGPTRAGAPRGVARSG